MLKGSLVLALGLLGICFPVAAQQAKHSRTAHHRVVASSMPPLNAGSSLSIYKPKIVSASSGSLLLQHGPLQAWSDGAQLMNESAFVQIGMAPLGLFPLSYLAPADAGPAPVRKSAAIADSGAPNFGTDGKDFSGQVFDSPLSQVYCTGEVGFMYGRWSGKGSGDYLGSYVWGQAGNDKFQISAGASFENFSGNSQRSGSFRIVR